MALACFGLVNRASAACRPSGRDCRLNSECCSGYCYGAVYNPHNGNVYGHCG
jgi:hypothetical protein